MRLHLALLATLLTMLCQVSSADTVTAFVPGKEWQASITLEGFHPFDVQLGPKTILGGSTDTGVTITVLMEPVEPGTTASKVRAQYGPRYAGGLDEKEGVELLELGEIAVITYENTIGGLWGVNGYVTKEDLAFDVHMTVDLAQHTRESVLAVLKSFSVEDSPESAEMASLWTKLTELRRTRDATKRQEPLQGFVKKYPHNSWARALQGEEYFAEKQYQQAAQSYLKALENHRTQPLVNPLYLWKCYDGLGICFGIQGKYDQSLDYLKRGYEVAGELEDEKLMAASSYNLACWYAENGQTEESIRHLREAIRLNEAKRKEAERDPSFTRIKRDPAFRGLMTGRRAVPEHTEE